MKVTHHTHPGTIEVSKVSTPEEAPSYRVEGGFKSLKLNKVVVIENGTEGGNSTVDLVFEDSEGIKHVALVMGSTIDIIRSLVGTIK